MSPEQKERRIISRRELDRTATELAERLQASSEDITGIKWVPGGRKGDGEEITEEEVASWRNDILEATRAGLIEGFRILEETPEFQRRVQAAAEFAQALVEQLRQTGDIGNLRGIFFASEGEFVIEAALEDVEFSGDPFMATVKADSEAARRHPPRYASSHPFFVTDMTDEKLVRHFDDRGYYPVDLNEVLSSPNS